MILITGPLVNVRNHVTAFTLGDLLDLQELLGIYWNSGIYWIYWNSWGSSGTLGDLLHCIIGGTSAGD